MKNKHLEFSTIKWQTQSFGIRSKTFEQNAQKIRLLELSKGLEHPDWCEIGHIGYVVEGELEINFNGDKIIYRTGDALIIASGSEEKHIPKPLSDKVVLFLVDYI